MSYATTLPSYRPATSKLACSGWKSIDITPLGVENTYSAFITIKDAKGGIYIHMLFPLKLPFLLFLWE